MSELRAAVDGEAFLTLWGVKETIRPIDGLTAADSTALSENAPLEVNQIIVVAVERCVKLMADGTAVIEKSEEANTVACPAEYVNHDDTSKRKTRAGMISRGRGKVGRATRNPSGLKTLPMVMN